MPSHRDAEDSAFIAAGGFDALRACSSDIRVSPLRVGDDPYEDVFVDIHFNFRAGYRGRTFGETDNIISSSCFEENTRESFLSAALARRFSAPQLQSPRMTEGGDVSGYAFRSIRSDVPQTSEKERSTQVNRTGFTTEATDPGSQLKDLGRDSGRRVANPEIRSPLAETDCFGLNNTSLAPRTPTGTSQDQIEYGVHTTGTTAASSRNAADKNTDGDQKLLESRLETMLNSHDNLKVDSATNSEELPGVKRQDHLMDHIWISRKESIETLVKRNALSSPLSERPSNTISPTGTKSLSVLAKCSEEERRGTAVSAADMKHSGHFQQPYLTETASGEKSNEITILYNYDNGPHGRTTTELENQDSTMLDPSNVGPSVSTMGGVRSTNESGSKLSVAEPNVKRTLPSVSNTKDIPPGVKVNPDHVKEPSDPIYSQFPGSRAPSSGGKEHAQGAAGAQADKSESSANPKQAVCGLLRQSSIKGVITTLRRTLSMERSASRNRPDNENGHEQESNKKSSSADGEMEENAGIDEVRPFPTSAQDEEGADTEEDEGDPDESENDMETVVRNAKKFQRTFSIKKAVGALRKIGSKEKKSPNENASGAKALGSERKAHQGDASQPRQNIFKRILSRTKSHDVAPGQGGSRSQD